MAFTSLYYTYLAKGIALFGGLLHATTTTHVFGIFILFICLTIIQLTAFYPRKVWVADYSSLTKLLLYNLSYYRTKIVNKMGEQFKIVEYPLILLFIITGALFLISANDLVSLFLSIELQSYGLYLVSTLYRNSELATTGGLTYFLLGGLSSCFILLGSSLLYANSGTTLLDNIYVITSLSEIGNNASQEVLHSHSSYYINISLLILSVGFLFKISAAPFHFWSPSVYDAIPTIVTAFVAIVAKISIFIFFLELVHYTSNSLFAFTYNWTTGLLVSALLSLILGAVLGLTEVRIKRLLAYSTISHLGFILLSLSINSIESVQAFIFYLMQYSLSNLNAFIILLSIGYSLFYYVNDSPQYKRLVDKNNSPIQLINQLQGYFYINPVLAISLTITIFSFVGIPPLIGFFAKQMVLGAALDSGYIFLTLVAILTSVISAVYYLNMIKKVYFGRAEHKINPEVADIKMDLNISTWRNPKLKANTPLVVGFDKVVLSSSLTITISVLTLIILLFIFQPELAIKVSQLQTILIFKP